MVDLPSSRTSPWDLTRTPSGSDLARGEVIAAIRCLWESKRNGEGLPARSAFSFGDLRPYLGRIAILEVVDGGTDFRFRLYGSQLADAYRGEMTGRSVTEFKPAFRDAIVPGYRHCLTVREPHHEVLDIEHEMMRFRWERIVLPLADDGTCIDQLMVYSSEQLRPESR